MTRSVFVIFLFIYTFCSCQSKHRTEAKDQVIAPDGKHFKSIRLFDDSSYVFTLRTIDTSNSYNTEKPTAVINFLHIKNAMIDTLLSDSLFVRNHFTAEPELQIEYEDFNFDGTKDIILGAGADPRSNYGYHLYVVDKNRKEIKYVDGFQEIGNPKVDSVNRVITSFVISGQSYWQFFFIDSNKILHKAGPTFNSDPDAEDSIEFQKTLLLAKKEMQKLL